MALFLSPGIANFYTEAIKEEALKRAYLQPLSFFRYVGDTRYQASRTSKIGRLLPAP
jgi:hypothetical protein